VEEEELRIDVLGQMGMRTSEDCVVFESVARRDGYVQRDVDNKTLTAGDKEVGGIWEGLPERLRTCFDVDAAARTVSEIFPVSTYSSTLRFSILFNSARFLTSG
jgi:hypothetical protein